MLNDLRSKNRTRQEITLSATACAKSWTGFQEVLSQSFAQETQSNRNPELISQLLLRIFGDDLKSFSAAQGRFTVKLRHKVTRFIEMPSTRSASRKKRYLFHVPKRLSFSLGRGEWELSAIPLNTVPCLNLTFHQEKKGWIYTDLTDSWSKVHHQWRQIQFWGNQLRIFYQESMGLLYSLYYFDPNGARRSGTIPVQKLIDAIC